MAYFDNAATTYPKPEIVYQSMDQFQRHTGGSFGRGNYGFSSSAKSVVDDTRTAIQQLLHCPAKQVVFEPSATISLNIIIQGIINQRFRCHTVDRPCRQRSLPQPPSCGGLFSVLGFRRGLL